MRDKVTVAGNPLSARSLLATQRAG